MEAQEAFLDSQQPQNPPVISPITRRHLSAAPVGILGTSADFETRTKEEDRIQLAPLHLRPLSVWGL